MDNHLTFGSTALVNDYLRGRAEIMKFFSGDFRNLDSFARVAKGIRVQPRDELAEILMQQNRHFGNEAALPAISLLRRPDTLAVVTGQQVGLFGGPLYTIYKALTAIHLGVILQQQLGVAVVPVFYLVSEDHDFTEICWIGWMNGENRYERIEYTPERLLERQPAGDILLDEKLPTLLDQWFAKLPNTEYRDSVKNRLCSHYAPGKSFSAAFCTWFAELFKDYGIVLLDAADPRLKPMMAPVFERELREQITQTAIGETDNSLHMAGYHSQLRVQENRPALFILREGRHSLQKGEGGFRDLHDDRLYTVEELLDQPQHLSPKAALRTVVQDTLLPTVAYVGGPGEIAYWAQLKKIYQAFDLTMPVVVPRSSYVLVEPKIRRHIERYAVDLSVFLRDPSKAIPAILHEHLPAPGIDQLQQLQTRIDQVWSGLQTEAAALDPTLATVLGKSHNQIVHLLRQVEQRMLTAGTLRQEASLRQLQAVAEHLLPTGQPQERLLNCVPYLTKFGPSLIDRLYDQIEWPYTATKVVNLD